MAKRIALYAISNSAAKYKKAIVPLFSFNAEFYIRLLFLVKDSPELCQENIYQHGQVLQCRACQFRRIIKFGNYDTKSEKKLKYRLGNFEGLPNKCPVCDSYLVLSGPYWLGNLHKEEYIKSMLNKLHSEEFQYLKYNKRITAILTGVLEVKKYFFILNILF